MNHQEAPKMSKKRRPTDRNLPMTILNSPAYSDSKFYQDLMEMERKLDWTMLRKKVEIQDALGKQTSTTRTLRIFLSHTSSDQAWQREGQSTEPPNFENGTGIPSWSFKIEGRLLDPPGRSREKFPQKKFSSLVKSLVVDLDRDPALHPTETNVVEWLRPVAIPTATSPAFDGFTVRRTGDAPVKARVTIHLDQYPEQVKLAPELASLLELKEDSRIGVVTALWNYIKLNNLQDKVDRRVIKSDEKLAALFGTPQFNFQNIPEFVNRYLLPPDPVVLHYTIKPNEPSSPSPQAWDVEIKVEDVSLKAKMNQVVLSMSSESAKELAKLDEQTSLLIYQIHNSQLKHSFLSSFVSDPAQFINTWLESQSRDLETVLGSGPSEGLTVREEELKRSAFFRLPWVEEAVAVQEGMRLASKVAM